MLRTRSALVLIAALGAIVPSLHGQEIRARVLDASTGRPVAAANVFLTDSDGSALLSALSDSTGMVSITLPSAGRYGLAVERIGYVPTNTPPVDLAADANHELDLVLRPEPIELAPIDVTVRDEVVERFLTLRGHVGSPAALPGFRLIRRDRVVEARKKARDNTDLLRWLFIDVRHGREVCIRVPGGCAQLFVDDRWYPAELIEEADLSRAVAVAVVPLPTGPEVHVFTVDWDLLRGR